MLLVGSLQGNSPLCFEPIHLKLPQWLYYHVVATLSDHYKLEK